MNFRQTRWLSAALLLSANFAYAGAVTVAINSGNPRYPFPQFMRYGSGLDSLADTNPAGVPHAEMEQWSADAWQIFANEFTYPGTTVGGVAYIKPNNGCPYDCTEGDGYALVAAAYMGDKTTFDGIWMRFHDLRLNYRPRYSDGVIPNAGYLYGNLPKDNTDSAADGDFDAALGILMAYYQWGANSGITVFGGSTMNYQNEAVYALDALVAKYRHFPPADCRTTSGDIGYDGYIKSGNTWGEMSNFANGQCPDGPEFGGPTNQYVDYAAPAYFNCFASFLQTQGFAAGSFDVTQYLKATASSDWLMGQHIGSAATAIPFVGHAQIAGITPTFGNVGQAEDFRFGWRTILNYIWNGDPATSWNPATHTVVAGANTYERAAGNRFANFLADPQGAPWNNGCQSYGGAPGGITFRGPATLNWSYTMNGIGAGSFNLNWLLGAGTPAAVASQNFSLMAKLFRQCTIEWDVSSAGDGYITSIPVYFHGFFRWLGMDILTGNHPDPCDLVAPGSAPPANMKIYKSVDRTYAFAGDTITYWLNYRNYSSSAANNVVVVDTLPAELGYVSAVPAPTSAPAVGANGVVQWNRGTVTGFATGGLNATLGGITLVAKVLASTGRTCNTSSISTSNGTGWTSNEYVNELSDVMKRNCVDIVPQVMSLTQTAAPLTACSGDKVTFTINLKDNPGNWLNGGRPNVVVSTANGGLSAASNQLLLKFRLMSAADEPYINYGNYRFSYFLKDAANPPGSWALNNTIYEGGSAAGVVVTQQALPPGPTWDQRVIVQFANQLAGPAIHLFNYTGLTQRIHKGGTYTLRAVWQLHNAAWSNTDWTDDWSSDPLANDPDGGLYYPITADWTKGDGTSVPVTTWDPEACQTASHTVSNILVEEWDGYTWRRAFGNGPVAGRQLANLSVTDVLPSCMSFGGFISAPVGMTGTVVGQTVNWTMAQMQINEADTIQYWVTVGSCAGTVSNTATMAATNENPISSSVNIAPGGACGGTPTFTPSRTPSPSSTATPTASASPSASATATLSRTPSPSPSASSTPSASLSPSPTSSISPSATVSRSATATPSKTNTPLGTPTDTVTPSASPSVSPSPSFTNTPLGTLTNTPTRTVSVSTTFSPSASPSRTATPTTAPTLAPTFLPSAVPPCLVTGEAATLAVGQPDLVSENPGISASRIAFPEQMVSDGTRLISVEDGNNRVLIWNTIPSSFSVPADVVLGQPDFVSGMQNQGGPGGPGTLSAPFDVQTDGTHLFVADYNNSRVLIWNSIPTVSGTLPDVVVGQPNLGSVAVNQGGPPGANTMAGPRGIYSDGRRLFVADAGNYRVLIWNSIPTADDQPADIVLGQPDFLGLSPNHCGCFSPDSQGFDVPTAIFFDGTRLYVADGNNNRVMVWNSLPSTNFQAADLVLGQNNFSSKAPGAGAGLNFPNRLYSDGTRLLVTDRNNHRVLEWPSPPVSNGQAAGLVLGQSSLAGNSPDQGGSVSAATLQGPRGLSVINGSVWVADASNNRLLRYDCPPATPTPTATPTATRSATATASSTRTSSSTSTISATLTVTRSATASATVSLTRTPSPTSTASGTPLPSSTQTLTATISPSFSASPTQAPATATPTISPTPNFIYYQQPELVKNRGVYPNPFSDHVRIFFTLRVASSATLKIYNVAGEPIFERDYALPAGVNEILWDGINEVAAKCASGVYLVRLNAEGVDRSLGGFWTTVVIVR